MARSEAKDRREIEQLLNDYCEIVDTTAGTGDWQRTGPAWTSLFSKDGLFQEGDPFKPQKLNKEGMSAGTRMMKIISEMFRNCSHQITNLNIQLDKKEPETAWAHSKFYVWQRMKTDTQDTGKDDVFNWGDYRDKLVMQDGKWVFAYRHAHISGQKGGEAQLFSNKPPQIEMPTSLSSRL